MLGSSPATTAMDNSDSFAEEFGSLPDTVDFVARLKKATERVEESEDEESAML